MDKRCKSKSWQYVGVSMDKGSATEVAHSTYMTCLLSAIIRH